MPKIMKAVMVMKNFFEARWFTDCNACCCSGGVFGGAIPCCRNAAAVL